MKAHRRLLAGLALLTLAACAPAPGPEVVATYDDGRIAAADIEAAILRLPAEQRRPGDGDFAAWFAELARLAAVERILLAEAEAGNYASDPELAPVLMQQRKQVLGATCLRRHLPADEPPTEAELRAYYDEHANELAAPGSRSVRHIFRRHRPGADAMAETEALRQRVLAGESFIQLAREHSQSESRHRDGQLGAVRPGQFAPALDRVIFSLEPRTPSEPVNTAEGVHLFWVETVNPGHTPSFDELRRQIAEVLIGQRRQERIAGLDLASDLPEDAQVADRDALRAAMQGENPAIVVLRIGDLELTIADLIQQLAAQGRPVTLDAAAELLEAHRNSELLYRRAEREGLGDDPEVTAQLEQIRRAAFVGFASQRSFRDYLERNPELLQSFYDSNQGRYGEPVRVRLERLRAPITGEANVHMAYLEEVRGALDGGEMTLGEAAGEVGGTVEALDWQPMNTVITANPQLASLLPPVEAGRHTPPYRTTDGIEMMCVVERDQPRPRPLKEVEDAVRQDYVVSHGQGVWQEIMTEMLEEHAFELNPAGLEAMAPAAAPAPDAG